MKKIKKVAIIGTGVIGAGWIIRCLAHNKIVYAFDRDLKLKKDLIAEIKRTWPYVKKLFNKKNCFSHWLVNGGLPILSMGCSISKYGKSYPSFLCFV